MNDYYGQLCTKMYESSKSYAEGKELDFYLTFVIDELIISYKKVHYNVGESILSTKLKYQSVKNGQIEKTEFMDFPLRLYEIEEFKNTFKSNGFRNIEVHGVKVGYGEGTFFQVIECS